MFLFSKKNGFTFIELIVTITIIALLFISAMPAYNKAKRSQELNSATLLVADVMEKTRQYSINPRRSDNGSVGGYCFQIFPGQGSGWQISELSVLAGGEKSFCSSGKIVERGTLPKNIFLTCETCEAGFSSEEESAGLPQITSPINIRMQREKVNVQKTVILYQNGVVDEK